MREIVDNSGPVIDHVDYSVYGQVAAESAPAQGDRFKYAGMEFDAAIELYYDRARWYDQSSGKFVSQDPTMFASGDSNLYRYSTNNPINEVDTNGNLSFPVGVIATGLLGPPNLIDRPSSPGYPGNSIYSTLPGNGSSPYEPATAPPIPFPGDWQPISQDPEGNPDRWINRDCPKGPKLHWHEKDRKHRPHWDFGGKHHWPSGKEMEKDTDRFYREPIQIDPWTVGAGVGTFIILATPWPDDLLLPLIWCGPALAH